MDLLRRLAHLVELRGNGLITGEVGSDKTTACRRLAATLHPGLYRLFYVPLSTGNVMDMYKAIAWQLGLPVERNRVAAYRAIHTEVCRLAVECRVHPVLVVDKAQHLRNDVLVPLLLPRISDQAAAQLLDILEQLLACARHHYAPQVERWQRRHRDTSLPFDPTPPPDDGLPF